MLDRGLTVLYSAGTVEESLLATAKEDSAMRRAFEDSSAPGEYSQLLPEESSSSVGFFSLIWSTLENERAEKTGTIRQLRPITKFQEAIALQVWELAQ